MACFSRLIRLAIGAAALLLLVCATSPSIAQQIDPTASAVKEQQLLQEFEPDPGTRQHSRSALQCADPAGRPRMARVPNVALRWIGGIAILGMLAVLIIFYLWRGMVRLESGRSGRTIVRFSVFERFVHWMTATCFIVLGDFRIEHHIRPSIAPAADRPRGVFRMVAMGKICA